MAKFTGKLYEPISGPGFLFLVVTYVCYPIALYSRAYLEYDKKIEFGLYHYPLIVMTLLLRYRCRKIRKLSDLRSNLNAVSTALFFY